MREPDSLDESDEYRRPVLIERTPKRLKAEQVKVGQLMLMSFVLAFVFLSWWPLLGVLIAAVWGWIVRFEIWKETG